MRDRIHFFPGRILSIMLAFFVVSCAWVSILSPTAGPSAVPVTPVVSREAETQAASMSQDTVAAPPPLGPSPVSTTGPTVTATALLTAAFPPAPFYTEPTVINTYIISNMPFHPGGAEGVVLALPGGVWTADMFSGLQQHDPQTGEVVQTVPLGARLYHDLKFDGERLWVLATQGEGDTTADALYVLDLPSGEVLETIPITGMGSYGTDPTQLGLSPGKIWVNFGIVNTDTFEYNAYESGLPSEAHFAYDGAGWMWITGSWCDGCGHSLWIMNAENPPAHKDDQNSGVLHTGTLGNPMVLAGGRMWVFTTYYTTNDPTYYLDAYDLDKTNQPALHIDVTAEVSDTSGNILLTADDHMVWIEARGKLYYFDSLTGEKRGELQVGEHITSMSFDGISLWVLCSDAGMVQVYLPWQQ